MSGIRYSIVITCYNQRAFIKDAVESALQCHAAKEVIVVDDGSQDGSLDVLRQFEGSVELLKLPSNCGVSEARNRGAAIAKGEYVIFLDGDDLFVPWSFEVYERLVAERHPIAIISGVRRFGGPVPLLSSSDDAPTTMEFVEYESLMAKDRTSGMYTGAFLIDRAAFQAVGGWSAGIWHLDTQDLYAKLAYSGKAILVLSPYTLLYRMHTSNSIWSAREYVGASHLILDREQTGQYPGGERKKFERYARHGGVMLFAIRKLLGAGLYTDALRLMRRAWPMFLATIVRMSTALLRGRRPVQVRDLRSPEPICHESVVQSYGKV